MVIVFLKKSVNFHLTDGTRRVEVTTIRGRWWRVALVTVCVSWCSPLCADGSVVFFLFCSQRTVKIASCENLDGQRAPVGDASRRVRRRETERLLSSQVCGLAGSGGIISLEVRMHILQGCCSGFTHVPGEHSCTADP